jgi:hypothetical protein
MSLRIISGSGENLDVKFNDDIYREGLLLLCDYRDGLVKFVIDGFCGEGKYCLLYDYNGLWRDGDFKYEFDGLLVGLDLSYNIFEPPTNFSKEYYFGLLEYSLYVVSRFFGYNIGLWRSFFRSVLYYLYEKEGILDLMTLLSGLEVFRNEATGVEKQAYTVLLGFLRCIFGGNKQFVVGERPIDTSLLSNRNLILDFSSIDDLVLRLFVYQMYLYPLLVVGREYPHLHVAMSSDYILSVSDANPYLFTQVSKYFSNFLVLHSSNPWRLSFKYGVIIIDNSHINYISNFRLKSLPALHPDSTHHMVIGSYVLPLRLAVDVPRFRIRELFDVVEFKVGKDIDVDNELALGILGLIKEVGGMSPEGVYIHFSGRKREEVYSCINWLWRMGYLRKEVIGRREVFQITAKGLVYLKKRGEEGGD